MFWVVAALLVVGALGLILRTLTARNPVPVLKRGDAEEEILICRAQLAELEQDVAAGLVPSEDAQVTRAEIERRLLDADKRRESGDTAASTAESARMRMAVIAAVALTPVAAAGLYLYLGHPAKFGVSGSVETDSSLPGDPSASGENMPSLEELAGRLEDRLKATPEDVRGWGLLGRTYTILGRYPEAAAAYRKAVALQPGSVELLSGLGEALALSAGGQVTPEALEAFRNANRLDPSDFASRYYLGKADYQRGKFREAMNAWTALAEDAPADAPWLPDLRREIMAVANELGVDPELMPPPGPSAGRMPAEDTVDAAGDMEQLAARLKAQPKDYEGWIRLARLRAAAGDAAGARTALEAGRKAYAGAPFVLQLLDQTASELGLEDGGSGKRRGPTAEDVQTASQMSPEDRQAMIEGMVSGLAARLEEDPDDAEGWRMLARSWRVLGQPGKSAQALGRLAELRPQDASAQAEYALSLVQLDEAKGAPFADKTVAALRRTLRLDEDNAQVRFYLGQAAAQRGDRAEAEAHWKRVIGQLPESSPLRKHAETLMQGG